jgi:hypothetical protein
MARKPAIALSVAAASLAVGVVASSPAVAGGRPTHVAFVHAVKKIHLHRDGSLTVRAWVRCKPGWEASDLTVNVGQQDASAGGLADPAVPCDNAFRRVRVHLTDVGGAFVGGAATISSQFLVTNTASGDSAAGHNTKTGSVVTY